MLRNISKRPCASVQLREKQSYQFAELCVCIASGTILFRMGLMKYIRPTLSGLWFWGRHLSAIR